MGPYPRNKRRYDCPSNRNLIQPAGSYHRFTPDESNYIQIMRFYKENHKRDTMKRSAETEKHLTRIHYLNSIQEEEDEDEPAARKNIYLDVGRMILTASWMQLLS
jgi:hypothetical protein